MLSGDGAHTHMQSHRDHHRHGPSSRGPRLAAHRPREVVEDLVSSGVPVGTGLGAKEASQLPCSILSEDKGRGELTAWPPR